MYILTFDIEEWYLEKTYFGDHSDNYKKYDYYLGQILDKLGERYFKGTFFCVGGMATEFPQIVKKIKEGGHEIGCHSFKHVWLNQMSEEEVYEDTRTSVDALEQCIGEKVKSYRAPAFSVGTDNKWAFEILSKCGIERDSSVFPAERDFGGFPQFGHKSPTMTFYNKIQMKEFPISVTKLFGKEVGYSGGGYFRFFPLGFVKKEMKKSDYTMTYFHIADLIPESDGLMNKEDFEAYFKIPGSFKNRCIRHIKSNLGKKGAFDKLLKLIETEFFVNLEQADSIINWDQQPTVKL